MEKLRLAMERFYPLSDSIWNKVGTNFETVSFSRKEVLTRPGQVEKYIYFLDTGIIRGYHIRNGQEYNIGFSLEGDPSGIIDSFISGKPSRYFLEAIEAGKGWRIERAQLQELYAIIPAFQAWGRKFAETLLVGIADRETSFLLLSAEERFQGLMERNPEILHRISQKHLASYLGMSPETFSRLRAKRQKQEGIS